MSESSQVPEVVHVYVDGLNLYYGCLKKTPYKWLDLAALCSNLVPSGHPRPIRFGAIRYFTALVDPDPDDPDCRVRQETYIRALRTIPNLTIKTGFFLTKPSQKKRLFPLYGPDPAVPNPANPPVWVWKVEEKGSDVNLATSLLLDAAVPRFDRAWVLTNDSDLAWPIEMVRKEYRLPVDVFKPDRPKGFPSKDSRPDSKPLIRAARHFRRIREEHLAVSLFPVDMTDADGPFSMPKEWAFP